ncbi:Arc family DNA-binding protein [Coralloluteibacterium thermophilus]|uniref:Arc family DNA-binding protein n=1 Tax=Coralloluteibacterium thermophilum TaxID=2707049 RepID=A0ABV9NHX9_9GAMM
MSKSDDHVRTQVRLPVELHEALVASANARGVSMNAEIVRLLQQALQVSGSAPAAPEDAVQMMSDHLLLVIDEALRHFPQHQAVFSAFEAAAMMVEADFRRRGRPQGPPADIHDIKAEAERRRKNG